MGELDERRVDVVVLTTLTPEQAALLPAASGDDAKLHTGETSAKAKAAAEAAAKAEAGEAKPDAAGTPPAADSAAPPAGDANKADEKK